MFYALSRLSPYILLYRSRLTLGLGCLVVTTAISLISPWILKFVIDDLADVGTIVTTGDLMFYALLLVGIALVGGCSRFFQRRIIIGVSRDIEYNLRNDFFSHLQHLHKGYFQVHRTGDLMSRATNDLSAVRMMVGPAIMYSASTGLIFIVATLLMLSIDVRLTLITMMPLLLVSLSVRYFGVAIYKRSEQIQSKLASMSVVVQEALAGIRVVRAYRREDFELKRFENVNREYVACNRQLIRLQGYFVPSLSFFLGLSALLVLWLGSQQVILGHITVGEFVAFNAYLVMLSWPMIAFGWVTNMLQRGMASWQRMLEVLDSEPLVTNLSKRRDLGQPKDVRGGIEFRNLTFSYNGECVLDGISASIEPGQTLALVGATGSGKSTLLSLLPRLHEPPPGTVFVDGVDVRDIPLDVLRGAIGYVPQEPFLFSDTLSDNVAFGVTHQRTGEASKNDQVQRAAAIVQLDKEFSEFPQGYDTFIGERGIRLSGGQKQRTALARALMVDPRILILDDALSAVDTHTEEAILVSLRGILKERTAIIVAHRISTVRDADLILVLDQGKIVERGTHEDLLACNGRYANMYRKQLLEVELQGL